MWPSSRLFTTERDGYFAICPSPRPNFGEDEVDAREQPLQTAAEKSSRRNKKSTVSSTINAFRQINHMEFRDFGRVNLLVGDNSSGKTSVLESIEDGRIVNVPSPPNPKESTMCQLTMTIPDESLAVLADSPEQAGTRMRMLAAVKLYEMKEISSAAAAQLAGVSRIEFLKRLADYGVTVFDISEDDLAKQVRLAAALPELFNPEGLWAAQDTDVAEEDLATARAEM